MDEFLQAIDDHPSAVLCLVIVIYVIIMTVRGDWNDES